MSPARTLTSGLRRAARPRRGRRPRCPGGPAARGRRAGCGGPRAPARAPPAEEEREAPPRDAGERSQPAVDRRRGGAAGEREAGATRRSGRAREPPREPRGGGRGQVLGTFDHDSLGGRGHRGSGRREKVRNHNRGGPLTSRRCPLTFVPMLALTFLGTGAACPTVERNVSALAVQREGETLLFDCGEGTQRQMMRYGVGFSFRELFFTHYHSDHLLGDGP